MIWAKLLEAISSGAQIRPFKKICMHQWRTQSNLCAVTFPIYYRWAEVRFMRRTLAEDSAEGFGSARQRRAIRPNFGTIRCHSAFCNLPVKLSTLLLYFAYQTTFGRSSAEDRYSFGDDGQTSDFGRISKSDLRPISTIYSALWCHCVSICVLSIS